MQMAVDPVRIASQEPWYRTYFHLGTVPFWSIHVAAVVGVAMLGWSWWGLGLAVAAYFPRMFFVTAGYHRYFSHRSFKTSRWFQFVLAFGAMATAQKGVLWWASHHRKHHKLSDQPGDPHAPRYGFLWSHVGWILSPGFERTDFDRVKDLARYPELRWLDRWWLVPPVALGVAIFLAFGAWALVWAFFVSQVLAWHGTFTINSLTHVIGKRRYATSDDSRNHWALALITMGEGWHNNHHHYQVSARQGFRWWEIDGTYYVLRALAVLGLVRELHGVPDHIREGTIQQAAAAAALDGRGIVEACGSPPPASSSVAPS
jgi:stearoyl-CoA desaturase (Delta-9 desaturase)